MHNITIEIDGHGTLTGDLYLLAILGELAKTASFTMAHSGEAHGAIKAIYLHSEISKELHKLFPNDF